MNTKSKGKELCLTKNKRLFIGITAIVSAIAICIWMLAALASTERFSLPERRSLFTLYDTYNMTVVVVFDKEPPIVQFIAPDGSHVNMKNIRYNSGSNYIQFFLPNAMPGNWVFNYDPLSNTEIFAHYSVYMRHIFIRDFEVCEIRDAEEDLPISFVVSADEPSEFNYELHAVFTDNNISEEILLVTGYGMLNEELALNINTEGIRDMGGVMLRLTVYVRHGQASIRDTAWLDLS